MDISNSTPVVSLRGVFKQYDQVQALSGVDVDLHLGRCHAFVGENGAGKSTLIKIIGGVVKPDSGTVEVNGTTVSLSGPHEALGLGIAVVPQS